MGKKNRKQLQKKQLCYTLTDRTVHRIVEDMWEKTSKWCGVSLVAPPQSTVWEEYDKLVSLIDHLKKRQGASPVPLPPREKGMGEFKDWLKKHGAVFDKLDIAQFPGSGCGLRVIDKIEDGEKVLQVPESLMLSWNEVLKSPLGHFVKSDPLLSAMPNLALAVVLLNERYNVNSFWRPYINVLPRSFDLPLFYSKEELQELNGSPVLFEAISQLRNISRLYAIIYQRLKSHNDPELFISSVGFNYTDFVWAVSCIMSRQNKIPAKESGDASLVLIPFWDMANHTLGKILTDYDVSTKSCVCYSMRKYSPGDEFMIFYGQRPNSDLFLNQGFTYVDNPYDSLKVPVGLSRMEDAMTRQIRHKLLENLRIQVPGQFPVKGGHTPFSPDLMAFTRVFTASPELLHQWMALSVAKLREILMSENLYQRDIKALEFLENRCSLLLQPYKTTLEEDQKLLEDKDLPYRLRCVVILRQSEKKILRNASQLAHREKENLILQLDKLKGNKESDESETSSVENENVDISETGNESNNEQDLKFKTVDTKSSSTVTNGLEKSRPNDAAISSESTVSDTKQLPDNHDSST